MRTLVANHGRTAGGLFGIATAGAMYFDFKPAGLVFAFIAIALVVASERMRQR